MALPGDFPKYGQTVRRYGITVLLVPPTSTEDFALYDVELQRAPDSAGAPNVGSAVTIARLAPLPKPGRLYTDVLPHDNTRRHYRWRFVRTGYSAGAYSSWLVSSTGVQGAKPVIVLAETDLDAIGLNRDAPFTDQKHAASADDATGTVLGDTVGQTDGTGVRRIAKGTQSGQARHTDAVTFSPAFAAPPQVTLRGGILYEPRAKWGTTGDGSETGAVDATKPQNEDFAALGVTASGFTVRARLRQKATQTAQSDEFSASNLLDAVGETTEANLDPAVATGDSYTLHYSVEIVVTAPLYGKPPVSGQIVVAIESNDGGGWIERATYTYADINEGSSPLTVTWSHEAKAITVASLGVNDDVRLRIKSQSGSLDSFAVHGFEGGGDPDHGVTYYTATDSYASKTPDADDRVTWQAAAV